MGAIAQGRAVSTFLLLLAACGGGGGGSDDDPAVPAEARAMESALRAGMARSAARFANLEAGMFLMLNGGSTLAPNAIVAPDNTAGAPPNSFRLSGTYDGNGNGHDETTIDGRLAFANDPDNFSADWQGAQGPLGIDIDILGVLHVYRGDLQVMLGANVHQLSGDGTFTNPVNGTRTTVSVAAGQPLAFMPATGAADAQPNLCAHSAQGSLRFEVEGPDGTLASTWGFAHDSRSASITGATFTATGGTAIALADSTVDLRCDSGGAIADWGGTFDVNWACVPRESGSFRTTIAVKDATTLTMLDDGDAASEAYESSLIGASPRAVRGFFVDGAVGARYREDFNWTLLADGSGFAQVSRYVYQEGPFAGQGGLCVARARRV
jgi:hypothetical protein